MPAIHEPSVLYFSASPRVARSSDQVFRAPDTDTAEEKFALGTAPQKQSRLRHLSDCRLGFSAVI